MQLYYFAVDYTLLTIPIIKTASIKILTASIILTNCTLNKIKNYFKFKRHT